MRLSQKFFSELLSTTGEPFVFGRRKKKLMAVFLMVHPWNAHLKAVDNFSSAMGTLNAKHRSRFTDDGGPGGEPFFSKQLRTFLVP